MRLLTGVSGLLDVESVGHKSEVGVEESEGLRNVFLHIVAGVENELHPSIAPEDQNWAHLLI